MNVRTPLSAIKHALGFTMVEIMVAMVISLFILGGAITVLVQNQQNYRHNDDFGRLQENARFALDMITGDLRMAGFFGCVGNNRPGQIPRIRNNLANILAGDLLDTTFYVDGWEDTAGIWSAAGVDDASIDIEDGTDAITVRRLRNRGVPITQNMAAVNSNIIVTSTPVNVGEIAAIYNCEGTDIFQTTAGTATTTIMHGTGGAEVPGNASANLGQVYTQNQFYLDNVATELDGMSSKTFVAAFDAVRYYIADDNGRPALWRQYHDGTQITTQALVEGIENMQIRYGLDDTLDGAPDDYRAADTVTDWGHVVAVKINLLVSTVEEYGGETDENTYDIQGTPGDTNDDLPAFGDRRKRKLVSATVLLRNMQARLKETET